MCLWGASLLQFYHHMTSSCLDITVGELMLRVRSGAEEMAQKIEYLPCKHDYLSLKSQNPCKSSAVAHFCNSSASMGDGRPREEELQKPAVS